MKKLIYIFFGFVFASSAYTATPSTTNIPITPTLQSDNYPWAVLFYWGRTTNNTLKDALVFNYGGFMDETLYSAEISRRLSANNSFRNFWRRFLFASNTELNLNFTYRDDPQKSVYEVDPYFSVRWKKFPWDKYLRNSFAIGEGISYDSSVPTVETNTTNAGGTRRLLNYLMFEITFALPSYPQWELVGRIHHRSGVFGLYGAENSGSSEVGVGVRYRF